MIKNGEIGSAISTRNEKENNAVNNNELNVLKDSKI